MSIYEVKVKSSSNSKIFQPNSSLILEVVAINAFGWELSFREIKVDIEISKGEENIHYKFLDSNKIEINTLDKGEVVLKIKPEYSLRPIVFTLKIEE